MDKKRLTKAVWLQTGLSALRAEGPLALRAEPLARVLKTTKGSFYWHFTDVAAFHSAMLDRWRTEAFAGIVAQLELQAPPSDRLKLFGAHVLADTHAGPIRAWAQSEKIAAKTLAAVDAQRLQYLSTLLKAIGLSNPDFARAAYGALIGMPLVAGTKQQESAAGYTTLIDLAVALK